MNQLISFLLLLLTAPLVAQAQKVVGGDISLLPTYEHHGVRYLDRAGSPTDALAFFGQQAGWNAMRVRLFTDPSKAPADDRDEGVRQDLDYATDLCRRIKTQGYALMLDLHYSDTWTDPGQHSTPAAWPAANPEVLADSVYRYTLRCLTHLKANGVVPEYIQVGNEVTYGMLWPTGRCYPDGSNYTTREGTGTFANFVAYLRAGIRACREVCPAAKVVIHTEMSKAWNVTTFYRTLAAQADYDIIGLSYYPDYHGSLTTFGNVLNTLEAAHPDKEIMVVETGYGARWPIRGDYTAEMQARWPTTEEGQRQFVGDLVDELNRHPKVSGLFWWMPEDNELGATPGPARSSWWDGSLYRQDTGMPLPAMFELRRFIDSAATGIALPLPLAPAAVSSISASCSAYNLLGQPLAHGATAPRGVYIQGNRKVVVGR